MRWNISGSRDNEAERQRLDMMESHKFRYYSPKFEADKYNPVMLRYAPWAGHRAFAYDYVMYRRPSCIVELGSHYGCSAFAFLQAMKDGGINGSFYAVDTWEGDSFTKNDYREDICGQYKEIQDACFSGQDSSSGPDAHMLRMTFDEASRLFADASIDLLHIDGSHLYEDVKHDFLTWKSKVRREGAIFFHDIAEEEMFGEVLGSHVFWKELKAEYSLTLEFPFSLGLGVLFFDEEIYRALRDGVSVEHYQLLANHADNKNRDVLRENFFRIRDLEEYRDSLKKQVGLLNAEIARYAETVRGKEGYISELRKDIGTLNESLVAKDRYIDELQTGLKKYASEVSGKDAYIAELEKRARELEGAASEHEMEAEKQNAYQKELEAGLDGYREDAAVMKRYIRELEDGVAGLRADAEKKQSYIEELREGIQGYQRDSALKEKYIEELLEGLRKYKTDADVKNLYIEELLEGLQKYKADADAKNLYIEELLEGLRKYKEDTDAKNRYIEELRSAIAEYGKNAAVKDARIAELLDRCSSISKKADAAESEALRYREELSGSPFGRRILKRMGKSDE